MAHNNNSKTETVTLRMHKEIKEILELMAKKTDRHLQDVLYFGLLDGLELIFSAMRKDMDNLWLIFDNIERPLGKGGTKDIFVQCENIINYHKTERGSDSK